MTDYSITCSICGSEQGTYDERTESIVHKHAYTGRASVHVMLTPHLKEQTHA